MATPRKKVAATETVTVTALVPVEHDGTPYAPGDTFDVHGDNLQQLLDVNAVDVPAAAE